MLLDTSPFRAEQLGIVHLHAEGRLAIEMVQPPQPELILHIHRTAIEGRVGDLIADQTLLLNELIQLTMIVRDHFGVQT